MRFFKSSEAAAKLGIRYHRLFNLLRAGKLKAPRKDSSGDYLWTEKDLVNARRALGVDKRYKPTTRE